MALSNDDKIFIKTLILRGYRVSDILQQFPVERYKKSTIYDFVKKFNLTHSIARREGSGRPRSVRTQVGKLGTIIVCLMIYQNLFQENIVQVLNLAVSPERAPRTSFSVPQISRRSGISRSSVNRIIKIDLGLNFFKRMYSFKLTPEIKARRLLRCRNLLNKFRSRRDIQKIWFTDEKIFTINPLKNSQNDRFCLPHHQRKRETPLERLLSERDKFTKYVMVSAGISREHKANLIFIRQGVRLNSQSYCDTVLAQMLPEIEDLTPDFIFMQVCLYLLIIFLEFFLYHSLFFDYFH